MGFLPGTQKQLFHKSFLIFTVFISISFGQDVGSSDSYQPLISEFILPTTTSPKHYDLRLKAYLPGYGATISSEKNLTFEATLIVTLAVHEKTQVIRLNEKDLTFYKHGTYLEYEGGVEIEIVKIVQKQQLEQVEFHLKNPIFVGKAKLHVKYSGPISEKLSGLYQTKYTSEDGRPRIAAATQMEAADARRMVPCFDEPSHKAVWKVTLVHPSGTTALANGIKIGDTEKDLDGFVVTQFKETPKMSSYLLAVLISEFAYMEQNTTTGVRLRVWARPGAINTAKYALLAGVKCLDGYEEFYGIPYPMDKLDMVAVPDFAFGAMENWGLVMYRENALLYDEPNSYFTDKQRVAQKIAHELAHMWFGNLVTMKFWDDIWLNEGFGAFVQNIGIDIIADKAFEMETEFVSTQHRQTLELDGTAASHPVIYPIQYQYEITPLFDVISYRKGASLIYMIRQIMGKKNFNKGVQNYLTKYSYKNAEHLDLFSEWDHVVPDSVKGPQGSRLNLTDFALKWTRQMGYPSLYLDRLDNTTARVIQERYKVDPEAKEREKFANPQYGYKWDIPVWIQTGGNKEIKLKWLAADGDLVINANEDEAVVLNADSYAIARMNYDEEGWRSIFKQLEMDPKVYSERTKYRIVSDAFAMADIGKVNYSLPFELTKYISKERDYLAWEAFLDKIHKIGEYFKNSPSNSVINDFIKKLIAPLSEKLNVDSALLKMVDDFSYMKNRLAVLLFKERCSVDSAATKPILLNYFKNDFAPFCGPEAVSSHCSRVTPTLRTAVYCEVVKNGADEAFENFSKDYRFPPNPFQMLGFYRRESLQLERDRLLEALTCTTDPIRIEWILGNFLNKQSGIIREQDLGTVAELVTKNSVGSKIVLKYLMSNWNGIVKSFGDGRVFGDILTALTSQIRDRSTLDEFTKFLKSTPDTEKYYVLTQQKQLAEMRIQWLEVNGKNVIRIFKEQLRLLQQN